MGPRQSETPTPQSEDNEGRGEEGGNETNEEDDGDDEPADGEEGDTTQTLSGLVSTAKVRAAIMAFLVVRPLECHPRYGALKHGRGHYDRANAAYQRGTEMDPPCLHCQVGFAATGKINRPPHPKCVILPGHLDNECTNCHYYAPRKNCDLRGKYTNLITTSLRITQLI